MSIRLQKNFYEKNNLDFSCQNTESRSKNFEFFEKRNMLQRGGSLLTSNQTPTNLYSI